MSSKEDAPGYATLTYMQMLDLLQETRPRFGDGRIGKRTPGLSPEQACIFLDISRSCTHTITAAHTNTPVSQVHRAQSHCRGATNARLASRDKSTRVYSVSTGQINRAKASPLFVLAVVIVATCYLADIL